MPLWRNSAFTKSTSFVRISHCNCYAPQQASEAVSVDVVQCLCILAGPLASLLMFRLALYMRQSQHNSDLVHVVQSLDGCALVLLAVEGARGRKLPTVVEQTISASGFLLFLVLAVGLIVRDTAHLIFPQ